MSGVIIVIRCVVCEYSMLGLHTLGQYCHVAGITVMFELMFFFLFLGTKGYC